MPGKVKVKIASGRNLPVMDRSSDTTDAYVEIKLGNTTYKTDVCRKSLHPQWNSEWYKFEVDDAELQDEPLQIRLMDHDTYSANDAIGKVYIDLNPLLLPAENMLVKYHFWNSESSSNRESSANSIMSGWIPVYDTMHGIRGEVNVTVKVELFTDSNRFRQSSCGVRFFCSKAVPHGYSIHAIYGFVEELVVDDDPEYQWIDKIRTPRASNEARQTLFFKLSGELQRKIGLKALDLGGNAVIGYNQCYDLEGESGIVARGIGTVVTLVKLMEQPLKVNVDAVIEERSLNYLKFLGYNNSFRLNSPPKIPKYLESYFPSLKSSLMQQSSLIKPYSASFKRKQFTRHLSHTDFNRKTTESSETASPIQHSSSLQTLLKQEDNRGVPGHGISQRLKNFRYSSHSLLSEKMKVFKSKLSDASSDDGTFKTLSIPELVEQKKKKPFKFIRASSDSSVMAELLVRSVMKPDNSLESILEVHDNSPPEHQTDEASGAIQKRESFLSKKTISEPLLSIPQCSLDTRSTRSTSSDSSSSDEDDNFDSQENHLEYDTVSNIVKNVKIIERKLSMRSGNISKELPFIKNNKFCLESEHISEDTETGSIDVQITDEPNVEEPAAIEETEVDDKKLEMAALEVPRFAEAEDFRIAHSDEEVNFFLSDPEDDNIEEEAVTLEKEQLPLPSDNKKIDSKLIIPPVMIGADIESKSLITTAMQTMLLDKVNIMGTYTPPMSPASPEKQRKMFNLSPPESMRSSPSMTSKEESFLPHITKTFETVRRSPTSVSLAEVGTTREICGAPFSSLSNIRCNANIEETVEARSDTSINNDNDQLVRARSVGPVPQKRFGFLRFGKTRQTTGEMGRRKSHEPIVNADENTEKGSRISFKKKMFSFRHRKGLLDTALKNVAMETVQDILATSHAKTSSPFASSAVLNSTNIVHPKSLSPEPSSTPANIEIDKGTSVSNINMHASLTPDLRPAGSPVSASHQRTESVGTKMSFSPAKIPAALLHRRSSDSDLSITPKGNSLTGSDRSAAGSIGFCLKASNVLRVALHQDNFDLLEYPFLTMLRYPPGFILHLGGVVSARSVKLLERISNLEKPESRDTWWSELRLEIRSHARALSCNAVLGYTETTSICDDVCVLSASGTAAVVSLHFADLGNLDTVFNLPTNQKPPKEMASSFDEKDKTTEKTETVMPDSPENAGSANGANGQQQGCSICHLPYSATNGPLNVCSFKCAMCKRGKVPDLMISTIDIPEGIPIVGHGCFLETNVCRPLRDLRSESSAKEISDGLPFLEYELHRLLITKVRIKGMNSIFGLKVRISIGEKMVVGCATGTAVFLAPLSTPAIPKLVSDRMTDEKKLSALQKHLLETVKKNKEIYQIKTEEINNGRIACENDDSEEEQNVSDLSTGSKDCCILEIEDLEDVEMMYLLQEACPPDGFHVVSTEFVPGLEDMEIVKNLQMFIQIWRAKMQGPCHLYKHFERLLQSVFFKLRRMIPCALCNLQFRVDLPEPDEIQLCVLGMALGLRDTPKQIKVQKKKNQTPKRNEEELIFNLEDYQTIDSNNTSPSNQLNAQSVKNRPKSPQKHRFNPIKQSHVPYRERHGVDITPLSYVPGAKIERYLGNLNFFLIRETTSIREEGGLSGFVHSFTTEVLAIVRAHVTALGGNAMVAYFMTECVLNHNLHKNQGQCLINVGGDVVYVSYLSEEQ